MLAKRTSAERLCLFTQSPKTRCSCAAKTHRELFSEFYEDLMKSPLEDALAKTPQPHHSVLLFQKMMHDLQSGGGHSDVVQQVSYMNGLASPTRLV